jgi:cobyrinic acid a,c-diamide synthase
MKGIIISGAKSGVGKTTITMAIMKALENVAPFKIGPDFIDPKFHEYATKNKSYNLDTFLLGEEIVRELFYEKSCNKQISVVEGVMGLYDGINHEIDNFSTNHISKILNMPVILIVDGKGISTSIAAQVLGYKNLDKNSNVKGIIINNISSEKSYLHLKEAIEKYCDVECLGYFPLLKEISFESRHLGLIQADELENLDKTLEILENQAKETIDLDRILEIAREIEKPKTFVREKILKEIENKLSGKRIGIAWDSAFTFYYNDNLELLEKSGIEIVKFSPIIDKALPKNIDFLYFGGGYPENYAYELSKNESMINDIRNFYKNNGKIYGECGGFIYLTKGLLDLNNNFTYFVGLLDIKVKMKKSLNIKRFGYINIETKNNILCKGHEFHYSDIYDILEQNTEFNISKLNGNSWKCGYKSKNLLAGYPHINFYTNIEFFKWIFGI